MPSSNIRDDLPAHQQGWLMKLLAELVVTGVGRSRTSGTAPRVSRPAKASPAPEPEVVEATVVDEPAEVPTEPLRRSSPASRASGRALPSSPRRTFSEADQSAQDVRERLRRDRGGSRGS